MPAEFPKGRKVPVIGYEDLGNLRRHFVDALAFAYAMGSGLVAIPPKLGLRGRAPMLAGETFGQLSRR